MLQATFAVLRQLLLDLGFTLRTDSKHVWFEHPNSNAWFVFPVHKDDEQVKQWHLVGVRRSLDEMGLLSREEFEEQLRSRLIAG